MSTIVVRAWLMRGGTHRTTDNGVSFGPVAAQLVEVSRDGGGGTGGGGGRRRRRGCTGSC